MENLKKKIRLAPDAQEMKRCRFDALSDLVLADIMASLPLYELIKMFCISISNPKLRRLCSLKWVHEGIYLEKCDFTTILEECGYISSSLSSFCVPIQQTFCSEVVFRRLYGRVYIDDGCPRTGSTVSTDACVSLINQVPGKLFVIVCCIPWRSPMDISKLIDHPERIVYIKYWQDNTPVQHMEWLPNLIMAYEYDRHDEQEVDTHVVHHRPSLLNGRDVMEVIRHFENNACVEVDENGIIHYSGDFFRAPWDTIKKRAAESARQRENTDIWTTTWGYGTLSEPSSDGSEASFDGYDSDGSFY